MADELKPVYLIAGSDRPKVDRAVARLRARFGPDAVELLDALESSGDDVVAACNAMGLFAAAGRLVAVDNVEAWKAADVKALTAYLHSPAPGTTLALVANELKKDAPLAKAVAAAGEVLIWDVQAKAIHRWIADQFTLHGATAEPEACRRLADLVGDDLYELAGEVEKLSTWAAGDEVTDADVDGVRRAAERMLDRTGDPISRTIPRLVGSLTNHVRRARAAHRLEAQGLSPAEAALELGIKPYPAQKLYGQVRNYTADALDAALVRLAALDHALKG